MKIIDSIPVIAAADEVAVRRRLDGNEPTIISGLVPTWPAYQRWSREHIVAEVGDVHIRYRQSESNVHPTLGRRGEVFRPRNREATVAEYLDIMAATPNVFLDANLVCLYARRAAVTAALAPLARDVRLPPFVAPGSLDTVGLWMSGRGVRSRLHYDRNGRHNLNAQLVGSKRVVLVSPDQVGNLYPFPMTAPTYNFSQVDSTRPDLATFPRYADVTAVEGTLRAGDLLFLPAFWYHEFTHLDEFNLNVNFWYDATDVRMTAVALRNEIATIWARTGRSEDPEWARVADELDRYCLSWSPARATVDELGPDGVPRPASPPPPFLTAHPGAAPAGVR